MTTYDDEREADVAERTGPDNEGAAWRDGYAFALRSIRADDGEFGTLEALAMLALRMRDPDGAAMRAWVARESVRAL